MAQRPPPIDCDILETIARSNKMNNTTAGTTAGTTRPRQARGDRRGRQSRRPQSPQANRERLDDELDADGDPEEQRPSPRPTPLPRRSAALANPATGTENHRPLGTTQTVPGVSLPGSSAQVGLASQYLYPPNSAWQQQMAEPIHWADNHWVPPYIYPRRLPSFPISMRWT